MTKWRDAADAAVRSVGIVPDEVKDEVTVETMRLIQVVGIEVHALFLESAVESFEEAIGLGVPGVVEEVDDVVFGARLFEVAGELTAIVCLDSPYGKGGNAEELVHEIAAVY